MTRERGKIGAVYTAQSAGDREEEDKSQAMDEKEIKSKLGKEKPGRERTLERVGRSRERGICDGAPAGFALMKRPRSRQCPRARYNLMLALTSSPITDNPTS